MPRSHNNDNVEQSLNLDPKWLKLRERLAELLNADRWVNGAYPIVEPHDKEEISKLLKGYPSPIVVVGSGCNFPNEFNPGPDTIVLLTRKIKSNFEISVKDQLVHVSAGWSVRDVNEKAKDKGYIIPALFRFKEGTVGGRLASYSSQPVKNSNDGWMQSLLGIEVALPSGEIFVCGGRNIKDVAGYDLKYLFTGSRGSMGVIVSANFRLYPERRFTMYKGLQPTIKNKVLNKMKQSKTTFIKKLFI